MEEHDMAKKIALAIANDIEGRSGLGDAWESIAEEIRDEIVEAWSALIREQIANG